MCICMSVLKTLGFLFVSGYFIVLSLENVYHPETNTMFQN